MRQSAFTILTPVDSEQVGDLVRLLNEIGDDIDENPHLRFDDLHDLHYASFFVVEDDADHPFLVFEGNVDGSPNAFLEQLLGTVGGAVDNISRHCAGYPAAGAQDAPAAG